VDDLPGVVDVVSRYSVDESVERLDRAARSRGLLVFARIDFSGDASRAGLALRPTIAILFGNPRAGTPVLAAEQRVGLDLPLRVVAWEDAGGVVRLSYDAPEWIVSRHRISTALAANLAAVGALVQEAASSGPSAGPQTAR
jgi:uncharacterized protein (DUF302 family)